MEDMLRPPINRAMRTLDRSFFRKIVPLSAAQVYDNKNISKIRSILQKERDALFIDRMQSVRTDPSSPSRKCILLRPEIQHDDSSTWTDCIRHLVEQDMTIALIPYGLEIDYQYWTYQDIIRSILPEQFLDEEDVPTRFSIVGHVAHLNLRDHALPYKNLIAQVLLDKNPTVRTVINKTQNVGEEDRFRTFAYEVLAGPEDMNVVVSEGDCIFKFDYSKVYWNTRLQAEHLRMISLFKPGEAVCDVMAGVGPFALPAGKRKVFTWANDLNPESFKYLAEGVIRNKVDQFVRPFNQDGLHFIRSATQHLFQEDSPTRRIKTKKPHREGTTGRGQLNSRSSNEGISQPLQSRRRRSFSVERIETLRQPRFFDHFVMNLPASAIQFLPSFIGLYTQLSPSEKHLDWPLPIIHVYTFALKPEKGEDNRAEIERVTRDVSSLLQHPFTAGDELAESENIQRDAWEDGVIRVHDVRDVAPKKRMFCISFKLPIEVAWATSAETRTTSPAN